jgi:hypothetical protein
MGKVEHFTSNLFFQPSFRAQFDRPFHELLMVFLRQGIAHLGLFLPQFLVLNNLDAGIPSQREFYLGAVRRQYLHLVVFILHCHSDYFYKFDIESSHV